ncbi:VCBS repeat-containing protein [bacterium]|nr:VCBS repeat-containing protein [bacterium]
MRRNAVSLCVALLCVVLGAAGAQGQTVERIEKLRDMCLETRLVADGKPAALIVTPQALEPQAKALQADVARVLGVTLPLRLDTALTEDDLRQQHCLALGNCNDNALLGRLYAMRMDFTDSIYPGVAKPNTGFDLDDDHNGLPDGWSITLHDETTHSRALDTEVFRSAPQSVRLEGRTAEGGARAALHCSVPLAPGKYELSVWYRLQPGEKGRGTLVTYYCDAAGKLLPGSGSAVELPAASDWALGKLPFEVPAQAASATCLLYLHGPGKVWYDDPALTAAGSTENLLGVGHPGAVVRTVHNPFGYGRNVIVLGASEAAGLKLALRLFGEALQGPTLPRLAIIKAGDSALAAGIVPGLGPDEAARQKMAETARGQIATNAFVTVRGVLNTTRSYARNYVLTGSENWALLVRDIWRVAMAEPDPKNNAHGPMEWIFQAMEGWDLVEESPSLTDQDRLDITNHLLKIGVRNEQAYGRSVQSVNRTIADGHQLDQALCLYMHGFYFDKYYHINGHWKTMALPLIKLAEATPRVHDSCGYGPIIATDFITGEYSLKTGDMEFFQNGNCRQQARWSMMCVDNLGAGCPFGDDGAWRAGIPRELFARANWYTRDDTLKWFLKDNPPLIGGFANDRPAQKPTDLMGVAVFPLHENLYKVASTTTRDAGSTQWKPEYCPPQKAFDKLSFRTDFGEQNQYMLVDGIGEMSHGHRDGASILRFTDNGRLFLTEGHYIETTPRQHNMVLVSRDGQQWSPPPLASLEHRADLPHTGLAQVLTSAYNGADWRRNILWVKEGFFVVFDELQAREAGDYDLECLWRSLGRVSLSSARFTVDQAGQDFSIEGTDGAACVVREQWEGQGSNYYASYPYSNDGLVKVLRQHRRLPLQAGQRAMFSNLLHTHEGAASTLKAERVADNAMLISGASGKWLAGVGRIDLPGVLRTDAALWLVADSGLVSVADATELVIGGKAQKLPQPSAELQVAGAKAALAQVRARPIAPAPRMPEQAPEVKPLWQVALPAEPRPLSSVVDIRVASEPAPLPASTWDPSYKTDLQSLARSWNTIVLWPEDQAPTITLDLGQPRDISRVGLRVMWTNNSARGIRYRLASAVVTAAESVGGPCREVASFTETGDHPIPSYPEYVKDTPGLRARYVRVKATPQPGAGLFLQGIRLWGPTDAGDRRDGRVRPYGTSVITALAAGDLDGKAGDEIVYGTAGGRVAAVAEGKERWTVESGARVNCLAIGNVTGDARPEVLIGNNGQQLQCYDTAGKLLWKQEFPFFWNRDGNVVWVAVADLNADGANEIAMAGENWHYYALDGEGKTLWKFNVPHSPVEGALGDVNGDGKLEIVATDEYYNGRVLGSDGKVLYNVAITQPYMTAALAADLNGDAKAEAVIGGEDMQAHVCDGAGKVVFTANVGSIVTDLQAVPATGGSRLLVASDGLSQNLSCYGATGEPLWRLDLPGSPRQLAVCGDSIAAACDDGVLRLVGPTGKLLGLARFADPVEVAIPATTPTGKQVTVCASGALLTAVPAP